MVSEDGISIHDEVAGVAKEAVEFISEVPRNLFGPPTASVVRDAGDLYAPRGDVDDEEDVVADEACEGEHLDGKGVDGCGKPT